MKKQQFFIGKTPSHWGNISVKKWRKVTCWCLRKSTLFKPYSKHRMRVFMRVTSWYTNFNGNLPAKSSWIRRVSGKHSFHQTNKWALWKQRERRGASTATNAGWVGSKNKSLHRKNVESVRSCGLCFKTSLGHLLDTPSADPNLGWGFTFKVTHSTVKMTDSTSKPVKAVVL